MLRAGKITRRTLLVGSLAIAGGAAFGIWKIRQPVENPLDPGAGATLNPYVLIDAEGVTVIAPRAEMGQGVETTLAALVAEEMDLAWEDVRVLHGPAAAAYYNGALMGMGLPVAEYAMRDWQHALAGRMGGLAKLMGLQITGGSTSTIDAFDRMRLAGASAREALKEAAAERLGLAPVQMVTEAGHVVAPDGTRLPYSALAEAAAMRPAPQVPVRHASEWNLLGRALPRTDMVAKATGTARFGVDTRLPGMRFATVRMCPRLGGTMLRHDAAAARAMPGVERVLDLGDGIAVVARNTWTAIRAAEAVEIEWGPAPYPETTEGIFAEIARALDGRRNSRMRNDGNAPRALDSAAQVIEAEYRVPFLAHATMEPMNATALYTGERLELWAGSQTPLLNAEKAGAAVGLPAAAVTIHTTYLGGGFGRRLESDYSVLAARVAREMPGTPVLVTWSREEDMRHDFYRPGAIARMRGAVANGRADAFEAKIAAPSVTRQAGGRMLGLAAPGPDKGHVEGVFDQPYAIPNYRVEGYLADLAVPVGFWRSVGNSFGGFFHECFIDELAHAAGRDPLEFRLEHVRGEHAPSAAVLETVAEMSGWTGTTPEGTGRGVALTHSFGTPVAEVIELVDEQGILRVSRAWIACNPGTVLDPGIVRAQMESGLIYGLSAAIMGEITFADGEVNQWNFPDYDALRIHNTPQIEVRILQSNPHMGGAGEPATPPSMPALANALFDLTGERVRELPLHRRFRFHA